MLQSEHVLPCKLSIGRQFNRAPFRNFQILTIRFHVLAKYLLHYGRPALFSEKTQHLGSAMHHTVFVADTPVGLPGKHPLFCLQRCLTTAALEATMAGAVRPVATVEGRRFE